MQAGAAGQAGQDGEGQGVLVEGEVRHEAGGRTQGQRRGARGGGAEPTPAAPVARRVQEHLRRRGGGGEGEGGTPKGSSGEGGSEDRPRQGCEQGGAAGGAHDERGETRVGGVYPAGDVGIGRRRRRRRRRPRRGRHRRRRRRQRPLRQTHRIGLPQGGRDGGVEGDEIDGPNQPGPGDIVALRARARNPSTRGVRAAVGQRRRRGSAQQKAEERRGCGGGVLIGYVRIRRRFAPRGRRRGLAVGSRVPAGGVRGGGE